MPGKYSHNVVLASYSNQGIISLPNDDQACYVKEDPYRRAASAAAPRQRKSSNATEVTGYQSLGRRSVKSVATPSQPRRHGLGLADMSQSRGRVVIADSDSEDDIKLHHQNLRSTAASYQAATAVRPPNFTRNSYAEAMPRRRRAADDPTRAEPPKALNRPRTAQSRGNETASLSPSLQRRSGVRAFMQARHLKETATEPTKAEGRGGRDRSRPLTMKELLASGNRSGTVAAGHSRGASEVSVADFLRTTSVSTTDSATTPEDPNSAPRHPPKGQVASEDRDMPVPHGPAPPVGSTKVQDASGTHARRPRTHDTLPDDYDLDFDGFTDDGEDNRFDSAFTQPSKSARLARSNGQQQLPKKPAREQQKPKSANTRTAKLDQRSMAQLAPAVIQRQQRRSISPALFVPREQRPPPKSPSHRNEAQSRTGHSQQDSVTSSQSRSQGSSVFGLSSTTQTTVVGSRDSPTSFMRSKTGTPHSWGLPRLDHNEPMDNAFDNMFDEKSNRTAIFTSDEEEDESENEYAPAPRLQTVDEKAIYSSNQFGTISSGRDVTAKDRDAISEMSAAFPPDIGRFKYGEEETMPPAISRRYHVAETVPEIKMPISQEKTKKSSGGGLLERLKLRKAR